MEIRRITIIGLGLIGGSLGRALAGYGYEITAVDNNPDSLDWGLRLGAAAKGTQDLIEGVKDAQVIFLATPVGTVEEILQVIYPQLTPGVIVTDVGSVKTGMMKLAEDLLPDGVDFVGGHPMAGKEQVGIAGADPLLFINAFYVLTPGRNCSQQAVEKITGLVRQIGAVPVIMDSVKHDRAVANVSHLPHLVAVALAQSAGRLEDEQPGSLNLAAGSFRDGTRVAESSPVMWQDICLANREMILQALCTFRQALDQLEFAVRQGEGARIAEAFAQAGKVRTLYKNQIKGKLTGLVELVVSIPDEPGALGLLTKALGEANINIINIEVLRVRDGLAGSVVLGFQGQAAGNKALEVIQSLGIAVQYK